MKQPVAKQVCRRGERPEDVTIYDGQHTPDDVAPSPHAAKNVDIGVTAYGGGDPGHINRQIFSRIEHVLFGWTDGARLFWAWIVDADPMMSTAQQAAQGLGVHPATFATRFKRAGVAAPHATIAGVRLVKCAYLAQTRGATITSVAQTMRYSSPQAFSRHVRVLTGRTPAQFFSAYDGAAALDLFIAASVAPHRQAWRRFDPLAHGSQWRTRPRVHAFERAA